MSAQAEDEVDATPKLKYTPKQVRRKTMNMEAAIHIRSPAVNGSKPAATATLDKACTAPASSWSSNVSAASLSAAPTSSRNTCAPRARLRRAGVVMSVRCVGSVAGWVEVRCTDCV